ncbi:MAG: ATP-binding cassette domain-containing protein, partial [Anaerolineales bacterium]|nr:ATP-binding cassette domain-containing protein [Anaerolineales bacterium]
MSDNKIIYSMVGVGKIYPPNRQVIKDISLSYFYGAKIGVLGLNGSGKSSLLRIMAGVDTDFIGETMLSPGFTVGFLEQEPQLDESKTVRDIVEEGTQEVVDALRAFDELNLRFGEELTPDEMDALIEEQGRLQDKLDHMNAWDLDSRLGLAMEALRCPPAETSVAVLSGGERRRVALCRLLLQKPDILLLDEPTNHLDIDSQEVLEDMLKAFGGTVLLVTHDRYLVDAMATQVWMLDVESGGLRAYEGNYSAYVAAKTAEDAAASENLDDEATLSDAQLHRERSREERRQRKVIEQRQAEA